MTKSELSGFNNEDFSPREGDSDHSVEEEINVEENEFLKRLSEDFLNEEFTPKEVLENRGSMTENLEDQIEAIKRKLNRLVDEDILIYDHESKTYAFDHSSPKVARILGDFELDEAA